MHMFYLCSYNGKMPIYVRNLIEDNAVVFLSCQNCGRLVRLEGPKQLARLGPQRRLRHVQDRLSCSKCGVWGDMVFKLITEGRQREKMALGLDLHNDWPCPLTFTVASMGIFFGFLAGVVFA
ncbi:hypothetical protein [Ruegeria sp. HKCCD8929]|uniref:hypothetical protein n=1 Tax=Ruegeria sp. HKCCD8929 TaxID=2683006 RepID=UPI001487D82B|nr:hypothetical protein [Ruegeria sp. HKCCD8929]